MLKLDIWSGFSSHNWANCHSNMDQLLLLFRIGNIPFQAAVFWHFPKWGYVRSPFNLFHSTRSQSLRSNQHFVECKQLARKHHGPTRSNFRGRIPSKCRLRYWRTSYRGAAAQVPESISAVRHPVRETQQHIHGVEWCCSCGLRAGRLVHHKAQVWRDQWRDWVRHQRYSEECSIAGIRQAKGGGVLSRAEGVQFQSIASDYGGAEFACVRLIERERGAFLSMLPAVSQFTKSWFYSFTRFLQKPNAVGSSDSLIACTNSLTWTMHGFVCGCSGFLFG